MEKLKNPKYKAEIEYKKHDRIEMKNELAREMQEMEKEEEEKRKREGKWPKKQKPTREPTILEEYTEESVFSQSVVKYMQCNLKLFIKLLWMQ